MSRSVQLYLVRLTEDMMRLSIRILLIVAGVAIMTLVGEQAVQPASAGATKSEITRFPEKLNKTCRRGRAKLFDECGDQWAMFNSARKRAAAEGKVLLVSFGAEWCIWCHVFDQYIHGGKTRFSYTFGSPDNPDLRQSATLHERAKRDVTADAKALRKFVGRSFVVVHIDGQYAPNGYAVLEQTGADRHYEHALPYIFTVDARGRFAAKLASSRIETRRDGWWDWYRGYSRKGLMDELAKMHGAAKQ